MIMFLNNNLEDSQKSKMPLQMELPDSIPEDTSQRILGFG